jgi:flagellin
MGLTINTNVASLLAQNNLASSQSALATSIQRLSSGMRINSAADDAAGLAISQRMTAQINGNTQAGQNANDAINLAQTAGSGLSQITNDLQRIRQLAVQSANGTNSSSDRAAMQTEVSQLVSEVDRIAQNTSFNGVNLLDGTFSNQQFQVGANAGQTITIGAINSARAATLGQSYSSTVTSGGTATAITAAGQFTVTDASGNAIDVYQGSNVAADAQSVANAINARGISGVSATAAATSVTAAAAAATAAHAGKITINGVNTATVTATGVAATDLAASISAINQISAATGVTASNVGGALKLSAVDGRNITVAQTGTLVAGDTAFGGGVAATTKSTYTLTSTNPGGMTVAGASATTDGVNGAVAASLSGVSVLNTDISTVAGANSAITTIDAALTAVNSTQATLGAIQNRFTQVVSSLQATTQNLTSARSGIQDTNFASETANLTRNEVLQQAGVAMLAQANSLPNTVLKLLQ